MADIPQWKQPLSATELRAIDRLESLGAVIKPFDVASMEFRGIVVRFDNDQIGSDGLITEAACSNLRILKKTLLELRQTRLQAGDLKRIARLTSLQGLDAAATEGVRFNLRFVRQLKELRMLDVSRNRITDADLEYLRDLTKLQSLALIETPVTDLAVNVLSGLKSLRELYLNETSVTAAATAALRSALPGCEISI